MPIEAYDGSKPTMNVEVPMITIVIRISTGRGR